MIVYCYGCIDFDVFHINYYKAIFTLIKLLEAPEVRCTLALFISHTDQLY